MVWYWRLGTKTSWRLWSRRCGDFSIWNWFARRLCLSSNLSRNVVDRGTHWSHLARTPQCEGNDSLQLQVEAAHPQSTVLPEGGENGNLTVKVARPQPYLRGGEWSPWPGVWLQYSNDFSVDRFKCGVRSVTGLDLRRVKNRGCLQTPVDLFVRVR